MIYVLSGLLGIVVGALTAKRRGGNRLDMAQYAAVFGIAFALIGLVITVILARSLQ